MFSDIENLDIILGEKHTERDESVYCNSARRPESAKSNMFKNNEENLYLNHGEMGLGAKILQVLIQMLRSTSCRVR